MPVNYTDKSIFNASSDKLNNLNAVTPGQISPIFATQGIGLNFGSQGDLGKKIAVTDAEIGNFTYTPNGTLYGGVYQLVQVSAAATQANIAQGKIAYLLPTATGYQVTDEAHALSTAIVAGVFLNTVTPGNYCFIFVGGGRVNVLLKTGLTNGTPAIGDNIVVAGGGGTADDAAAGTTAPTGLYLGNAVTLPASNTLSVIYMERIKNRI